MPTTTSANRVPQATDMPLTMPVWPDAAKVLGLGRSVAYEMVRSGTFPCRVLRLGGKIRVSRADLLRYLGESEKPA